jgi:hypothetical protein
VILNIDGRALWCREEFEAVQVLLALSMVDEKYKKAVGKAVWGDREPYTVKWLSDWGLFQRIDNFLLQKRILKGPFFHNFLVRITKTLKVNLIFFFPFFFVFFPLFLRVF